MRIDAPSIPEQRGGEPDTTVGCAPASEDLQQTADERLARSEREIVALRREIAVLQNTLADLQVQSARHAPLLDRAAFMLSGTRMVADRATAPLRAAGALANIPATAKRLSEVRLRSERLVRDGDGRWAPKLDVRAYLANASRALGLANIAYRGGATTNIEVIDAERSARDAATQAEIAADADRQARLTTLAAIGRFPDRTPSPS